MATTEETESDHIGVFKPELAVPQPRTSPGPIMHDVYRQHVSDGSLDLIATGVEVKQRGEAGRREAIQYAVAELPEDQRGGTFRTCKPDAMSDPITLAYELVPQAKWS